MNVAISLEQKRAIVQLLADIIYDELLRIANEECGDAPYEE